MEPKEARSRVFAWARKQIEGQAEVHAPDFAEMIAAYLGKEDDILLGFLHPLAYRIAVEVIGETRGHAVEVGDTIMDDAAYRARLEKMAERLGGSRWERHLEYANGRHVRATEMDADDLADAARVRGQAEGVERRYRELWEALAKRLKPGEAVKARWKSDEIEATWRKLGSPDAAADAA